MIALEGVCKSYDRGKTFAVSSVDLEVNEGELVVLLGESGCGKTTTLKMINRLIEPGSGTVRIGGTDIRDTDPVNLRRGIGYVFQGIGLFPHMTVGQNVAAVPRLLGWSRQEIRKRVHETLEMVSLDPDEFLGRYPRELSGGQSQRVGVARALAVQPRVVLMDEPFGALDPLTRTTLQEEFQQLRKRLDLTVVLVTHDMTEALLLADRIAVMQAGNLLQMGEPHDLLSGPKHEYVRRLMETPKRQADRLEELASRGKSSAKSP